MEGSGVAGRWGMKGTHELRRRVGLAQFGEAREKGGHGVRPGWQQG
jgi:hypothetical protein